MLIVYLLKKAARMGYVPPEDDALLDEFREYRHVAFDLTTTGNMNEVIEGGDL